MLDLTFVFCVMLRKINGTCETNNEVPTKQQGYQDPWLTHTARPFHLRQTI
jgi:hypothetical protein